MNNNFQDFKSLTVSKASAGSGKTFTLAAYYVALLLSGESFKHILAVTFTNKATEEMKSRILSFLYAISNADQDSGTLSFIDKVCSIMEHLGAKKLEPAQMKKLAGELYRSILAEYDEMHVLTIDSFLQTLYSGMAQAIGMPSGMGLELDVDHAITTAVDQLLSNKMLNHDGLQKLVGEYIRLQLDDEGKTDIRKSLISIAKEIYKESVLAQDYKIVYKADKLDAFRRRMKNWQAEAACVEAQKHIDVLEDIGMSGKFTRDGSQLTSFYKNYIKSLDGTAKQPFDDSYKIVGFLTDVADMPFNAKVQASVKDKIYGEICELVRLLPACRKAYFHSKLTTAFLRDVQFLAYIRAQIDQNLAEDNSKLLATAASDLTKMLRGSVGADAEADDYHGVYDGSFLLEKAGIRYHHVMLDEFQDTSNLQWINFLNLILEVLQQSEEGRVPHTCFIVGDIKQSIYRFRNGDWHIMDSLDEHHQHLGHFFDSSAEQLSKSFRSRYEVVRFNVSLFRKIAELENARIDSAECYGSGAAEPTVDFTRIYNEEWSEDNKQCYYLTREEDEETARRHGLFRPDKEYGHEGGFVRCRFYPKLSTSKDHAPFEKLLEPAQLTERILTDMFLEINQLLEQNPDYARDILILVRNNSQETPIVERFRQMQKHYPALAHTGLVTESSYRLDASRSVLTLIGALRFLVRADGVGRKYARTVMGKREADVWPLVEALDRHMPLTDLIEELIRLCLCSSEGDFLYDDVAYVNCFSDRAREFVSRYGSDPEAFLTFWEDKLFKESVSIADTGLIRIMTLHKSKGLEAKTLFVPFCDWSLEKTPFTQKIWCSVPELTDDAGSPAILPIEDNTDAFYAGFAQEYRDEHEMRRLDNINLLYVGLTRAADNLFVYGYLEPASKWKSKEQCFPEGEADASQLQTDSVAALILNAHGLAGEFDAKFVRYLTDCKPEVPVDTDEEAVKEVDEAVMAMAENCYVEILRGERPLVPPYVSPEDKVRIKAEKDAARKTENAANGAPVADPKPFSFKDRQMIPVGISRTNDNIEFRQSQDSMLYGTQAEEHIRIGNICHDLMAHIAVRADVPAAIEDFCTAGIIDSPVLRSLIEERIADMWQSPEMCDWFSGRWRLLLEEPLLALDEYGEVHENRMDRVMIDEANSRAVVLDYKFGTDIGSLALSHYQTQVRGYMHLLSRMGYTDVSGYLWLAEDKDHLHSVSLR